MGNFTSLRTQRSTNDDGIVELRSLIMFAQNTTVILNLITATLSFSALVITGLGFINSPKNLECKAIYYYPQMELQSQQKPNQNFSK